MASQKLDSEQSEQSTTEVNNLKRLSRLRQVATDVAAHVRRHPIRNISLIILSVTAVIGMGFGLLVLAPENTPAEQKATGSLEEALAALDIDDRDTARSIAADLRLVDDLPAEQRGGPAFVLGMVMFRDAEEQWNKAEQRVRFLLAAGWLEEAKESGFPARREADGLFTFGKALHASGRFAQSLPVLHEALPLEFNYRTEIQGLLADSYLRDSKPNYVKALEHIRSFLADDALSFEDRYQALMTQGEIMFGMEDFASCEAAISSIPEASPQYAKALLLKGRLLLDDGDELADQAGNLDAAAAAIKTYEDARELFGLAQLHNPTDHTLVRQVHYLTALTYRKTAKMRPDEQGLFADLEIALEQFGRTRRSHFDTAEGISASLEEAEIHQLLGEDDIAVAAFRRTLNFIADSPSYNNAWVPEDQMKSRIEAAYSIYRDAGSFDRATQLASSMKSLFSEGRAVQLQAETREAAADELANDAKDLPLSESKKLLVDSRTEHRNAGALYAQLAKLRFVTRSYADDLWKAADNYLQGQDYERAVRYLTQYLDTQNRAGRPPALTSLGQAMLALNEPEKALPYLMECIEYYPRDPHSYRARVIAAQAYKELGNLPQAKALLEENLEHESLTPRSIEWRESLFALGDLLYLEGVKLETKSRLESVANESAASRKKTIRYLELAKKSFDEAISRLDEAVQRDPDAKQAIDARYRIADSYRHAAKLPRRKLEHVTIDTTRKKLTEELNRELRAAESGYSDLIELMNARQERFELSSVEQRILRNCYFARADALYDMERYEDAIQAYSNATNRYQQEPESLEAYVQIANCHRRRNRPAEARGTFEQAKVILRRIRPEADFLQTTRYNRDEWEKVLTWLASL